MRPIDTGKHARPEIIDPGPAPMLQWLKIAQLVIDDSYQRPLAKQNRKAIAAIAAQFRWSRFSPVFAAPIEGGLFAVIDGQHRTHAAALCGFSEVPCQIVQMSLQEQAESFSAVNGLVTKVTTGQLFKAALAAGEERAVRMDAIARAGGCRLMTVNASAETKKPGEIFALKAYGQCVDQFKENRLIATLQALMAAEGYCDTPEIWAGQILFPIIWALARIHRDMGVDVIV
ncbi:MAG: ParB N-terminal domain-containing protein [Rhizobiaceae bacterium]|nr:ParB N-terminal domain-containing protein [Rhizobiaceae bacterium]